MTRRSRKNQPEEPVTVAELLENGLVKPASEIHSPDPPPHDSEVVPAGPKGPRRSDQPRPLGDVLGRSPAVAAILASREPEQTTSMETVAAGTLAENQKPSHVQRLSGLRPAPKGFVGLEGHFNAGIRLTRSLDKRTVAVQFADDRRPSRDGSNPEKQRLDDRGFRYQPDRSQWEKFDEEQPGENYQDAKESSRRLSMTGWPGVATKWGGRVRQASGSRGVVAGVGKHDFQPSGEVVHGTPRRPEMSRHIAVIRERDALAQELREIQRIAQAYNQPDGRDLWKWLNEVGDIAAQVLAKLASSELRKPTD